jgi:hypothetical protein
VIQDFILCTKKKLEKNRAARRINPNEIYGGKLTAEENLY